VNLIVISTYWLRAQAKLSHKTSTSPNLDHRNPIIQGLLWYWVFLKYDNLVCALGCCR